MTKLALVIGATGGVGGATARALLAKGWRVRAMHRDPAAAAKQTDERRIEWVLGDAMSRNDVVAAAQGATIIFHGANPPAYRGWAKVVLPMMANTIEAARITGARIFLPGTVYNYGPDAGSLVAEDAPQKPLTRKGEIRAAMERMLKDAAGQGVRSIVLRAGDFYGVGAPSSWFQTAMVKPGKTLRSVTYPGLPEVGHSFAYLPDLADTFARLAEREAELPDFETFHFEGHALERGVEIAEAVASATGNPKMRVAGFPWAVIYALAPFVETFHEMIEMRYLWKRPLKLDNAKLVAFLGGEPRTDLDEAVRATLEGLGCLPHAAEEKPAAEDASAFAFSW